jgi:hypothetical protein
MAKMIKSQKALEGQAEATEARPVIVKVTVAGSYKQLGPTELGPVGKGEFAIGWIVIEGACAVDILDKDFGNISFDFVTPSIANLNVSNPQLCTCGRPLLTDDDYMKCEGCGKSPGACECTTCGICGGPIKVMLGRKYCASCLRPAYLCNTDLCL